MIGDSVNVTRPIKVLIVDTAIAFGGTLTVARNLLKHLDPEVVDASIVSACADGFVSVDFADGATVRLLAPAVDYVTLQNWKAAVGRTFRWSPLCWLIERFVIVGGILGNIPYMLRLGGLCLRLGVDVIHANNYTTEPLWTAHFLRIPVVYHLHGCLPPRLEGSARESFRHVRAFIAISKIVAEAATRAGIDPARIHIIPNFVEQLPDAAPLPMPPVPAVGIFGRVTPWKGQKEFLLAALQVLPTFPDLRVYIVGDTSDGDPAYMEECQQIARASPFADRIEFTGRITDVGSYYRRCTVVVHASIEPEPFGMVLIEAMAESRPVIASTFGAANEIIEHGVEGYLVDPGDTSALAMRITELVADPALAAGMGAKGKEKVRALFQPDTGAPKFERVYMEVVRAPLVSRHSA